MTGPTAADVRAAYPEFEITLGGDGEWHARLTTGTEPQQELTSRTIAGLAVQINHLIAGGDR